MPWTRYFCYNMKFTTSRNHCKLIFQDLRCFIFFRIFVIFGQIFNIVYTFRLFMKISNSTYHVDPNKFQSTKDYTVKRCARSNRYKWIVVIIRLTNTYYFNKVVFINLVRAIVTNESVANVALWYIADAVAMITGGVFTSRCFNGWFRWCFATLIRFFVRTTKDW